MDDLYENLENYHDENIIDELRVENKELKTKLEEYSVAMIRLQKDFDKLNTEYKKLETNYSSLLKTARAEIERKSEMIKSLNSEKDLLIIKTLQTTGKNIRWQNKHGSQQPNKGHKLVSHETECNGKMQLAPRETQLHNDNDRIISHQPKSADTVVNLDNKSNFNGGKESKVAKNFINKTDRSKENISNEYQKAIPMNCSKTKGDSNSDRGISTPICSSIEARFSSDEDVEDNMNKRKSPFDEDIRHYEKYSNKQNCYFSSNDRIHSSKTKRLDNDRYRHDRYDDSGLKYVRRSPEKYRSKYTKDHRDTYKSREDCKYNRQRVLKSPHVDKFTRSKSRDKRMFEKEYYYDKDRHSSRDYDKSRAKHKISNESEEPSSKRQKTDDIKKGSKEKAINIETETELGIRRSNTKQQKFIESSSCQSPDYANIDSTTISLHVAKEIKHTAVTALEDPRVSSKKYAIKTNKEKVILCTISNNVDIKPVNVNTWDIPNIKKFIIPPALTTEQLPENIVNNHLVDEIYMDIRNPILNDSLESGEIESLDDCQYTYESNVNKKNRDRYADQSETIENLSDTIPHKVVKPDKNYVDTIHNDNIELIKIVNTTSDYCNENIEDEIEKREVNTTSHHTTNKIVTGDEQDKEALKSNCNMVTGKAVGAIGILANDLELSDETGDIRDVRMDAKKWEPNLNKHEISMDLMDSHNQKKNLLLVEEQSIHSVLKERSKPASSKKVPKDSSTGKYRKTKKKDQKQERSTDSEELQTEPKLKDKQSKPGISIETKNKFSDLFGDSSSLITPDDLGVPPPITPHPLSDKYIAMYDNTQDAMDLSVDDISRAKCSERKASTFPIAREELTIHKSNVENSAIYNLNDTTINEASKIVKTVIISTGVQPNHTIEDIVKQCTQKNSTQSIGNVNNGKTNIAMSMLNNLHALATSTPQKPEPIIENVSTAIPDPNVSDNTSCITENTNNLSCNVKSSANLSDNLSEVDAPDVRIFVRRRRKINVNKNT